MIWKCRDKEFDLNTPVIAGVLNITPDSFSDGSKYLCLDAALKHAHSLRDAGAHIIEIGAESTRPGSVEISSAIELSRIVPVLDALLNDGFCVSIDTRHPQTASVCLEMGAYIINDISGFVLPEMRECVAGTDCGCVVMHMQGSPRNMQNHPVYKDVVEEVSCFLSNQAQLLEAEGVKSESICIDPGIGFGKTFEDNIKLFSVYNHLSSLCYPLMCAVSRKSFIGKRCNIAKPEKRDNASALAALAAVFYGASIVRTHNPSLTLDVLQCGKRAFVALGSNIGNKLNTLLGALKDIATTDEIWLQTYSHIYESEPAYKLNQEPFYNAVAEIFTTLSPQKLLIQLHKIEHKYGRLRLEENGPRTLDLDIVDYEGCVIYNDKLILPHPRILERDFVVTPLFDIDPNLVLSNGKKITKENVLYGHITSTVL